MERWQPLRPLSGWSTLPLIALCVVLLVTAFALTPSVVIHGPRLATAATAERLDPRALTVAVDKLGGVWVGNGTPGVDLIERVIRDSLAARPASERRVHLLIDQDLRYELAQTAISALSRAGLREIDLLVDCPRGRDGYARFCAAEPATAPEASRR